VATPIIERRVARLEAAAGGGGRCPDCGGPSGAEPDDHSSYEVVWVDPGGPDAREERCETCGRQTAIVIRWPEDLE
jgi:hypothetical protein